jgi:hyaluronan synthase/N-acetylglucosaminyltransferase
MLLLWYYFVAYGVLALSRILVQIGLGHWEYLRQRRLEGVRTAERTAIEPPRDAALGPGAEEEPAARPLVSVIVPVFEEASWVLAKCLHALTNQDYEPLEVIVVDDGSPSRAKLELVYSMFATDRVRVIEAESNMGKRTAQKLAFDAASGDFFVTVDSDTILPPNAVSMLLARFADPKVGAVTANIGVENAEENLLTRLIGYRYWMAFNQERAAQSRCGVMMCCSGPLSCYRRTLIDKVKERYLAQRFLGKRCTFGDDRHLTNLVLDQGAQTVYMPLAPATTYVPTTLRSYLRQQVRWNRSFYREAVWSLRLIPRLHPYFGFELLLQVLLPFMLLTAVVAVGYHTVAHATASYLYPYLAIIVALALLRSLYGMARTRDPGFALFISYGFIHLLLLIPTRLYALATLRVTGWGTRGNRMDAIESVVGVRPTDQGDPAAASVMVARPVPGVTLLRTEGELGVNVASRIRTEVFRAVTDHPNPRLVADFTNATFVESTTLGVLIGAVTRLNEVGGRLAVVCPAGVLERAIRFTKLAGTLSLSATPDEALAKLGSADASAADDAQDQRRCEPCDRYGYPADGWAHPERVRGWDSQAVSGMRTG